MKMILNENDIYQAVIEYLSCRGVKCIAPSQLDISRTHLSSGDSYQVEVRGVNLQISEGPYR